MESVLTRNRNETSVAGACVWLTLAASIVWTLYFSPVNADSDTAVLGLGYGPLGYTLPEAGSYNLADLGAAEDGSVVLSSGEPSTLHALFDGRITLLSFMYSSCSDVNGCPLAASVLHQLKSRMQKDPILADRLQLISMSFDPEFDTPERMQLYERGLNYAGDRGAWTFVTAQAKDKLRKILLAYKQDIVELTTREPSGAAEISHLLRVYLIDENRRIRNIYSVSFLHADILTQDVRTLILETQAPSGVTNAPSGASDAGSLSRPGDDKSGYEKSDYKTDTLSLNSRVGRSTNLLENLRSPPLGLPPVPVPDWNPATQAKVQLGRKIFYDRRLSINDTFSCASCHVPEQGFTSNELATAVGVEGRSVRRNTMSIYNVGYASRLFHDGREENLEQQVWSPFLARNEMANPSIGYVLQKFRSYPDYGDLFEKAFPGRSVSMETVGMALASYQRTLVSANSPFDQWKYGKDPDALSETAKEGFRLFTGKAKCAACHLVSDSYATFSDYAMHNTGLGYRNSLGDSAKKHEVQVAPGLKLKIDAEVINRVGERPPADVGLYEITEDPDDRWHYRTPSLRNVALTAPYMHNGELSSLQEVVEFYNQGGVQNPLLDPLIRPLGLNKTEVDALVEFMHSLTGSNVDELVSDAFAVPIGDPGAQQPKTKTTN